MKKELRKSNYLAIALLLLAILLIGNIALPLKGNASLQYSPFLPGLAPFDVGVILGSAPTIDDLAPLIYMCEGAKLEHAFNVTDLDKQILFLDLERKNPFFINPLTTLGGVETHEAKIITTTNISKDHVDELLGFQNYYLNVTASDGETVTNASVTITVIEKNNGPAVHRIGVQTIWTQGENSTFNYQVIATDVENGNIQSQNLPFTLNFLSGNPDFGISPTGRMQFIPSQDLNLSQETIPKIYDLEFCISDQGISPTHALIQSICGQTGGVIQKCQTFSLTVTDENRAPEIKAHTFPNETFSIDSGNELVLNVNVSDPDGTHPDVYWYLDGGFLTYQNGTTNDPQFSPLSYNSGDGLQQLSHNLGGESHELIITFGNDQGGEHVIEAVATDGLLNASILTAPISVNVVSVPQSSGGGGGGSKACKELWGCLDFNLCQNRASSHDLGLIDELTNQEVVDLCSLDIIPQEDCGLQLRTCFDANACNTTFRKPTEIGHCYYSGNPTCFDGIKNCHGGGCELLIDCGGICGACASCSDAKRNQGETGKDCGGPCALSCPDAPPLLQRQSVQFTLVGILVLVGLIILWQVFKLFYTHKKVQLVPSNAPLSENQRVIAILKEAQTETKKKKRKDKK